MICLCIKLSYQDTLEYKTHRKMVGFQIQGQKALGIITLCCTVVPRYLIGILKADRIQITLLETYSGVLFQLLESQQRGVFVGLK